MKNKVNKYATPITIATATLLVFVGAWGVMSSFNASDILNVVGSHSIPTVEFTAEKLYFSYGNFTVILMSAVFVLFSTYQNHVQGTEA
jgi:hypothetical protein